MVTISDAGVAAWVNDRERLRAQGYPDRPPSVDTNRFRAWTDAGDDPSQHRSVPTGAHETLVKVWGARHAATGVEAKLLIYEVIDGFDARFKVTTDDGFYQASQVSVPSLEDVNRLGAQFVETLAELGYPVPVVLTALDVADFARTELAG